VISGGLSLIFEQRPVRLRTRRIGHFLRHNKNQYTIFGDRRRNGGATAASVGQDKHRRKLSRPSLASTDGFSVRAGLHTYLGIEAYGLIGIFAILQAWFALLDFGVTPTLVREMSRFAAGTHDAQSIRNLLRTTEVLPGLIVAAFAIAIWIASPWLAQNWVTTRTLAVEDISHVFSAKAFGM